MSEPPLKRRRLSPSLPLESPHEPGTSEIFNPNFDEDAMAQQMMDTLFQGALDALEQPQTGSTEGMNDYEQQWEPSGEPPMDGMREEWDDFIGEPEEQSERADQGKALEVELFGEDDTDGGTYAQREKQQQNQGDTWPEDQNQEDELASAAASMLQDSLAQAMAQHGLPEMSQQEEEDLADAAAGMLNDSLAQALEGWDEGEFRLQETEEPSIRGEGAAMASQQKLQQSQSLHRPSPPTRLPSSRTSPPAAASAHPSEPFQLHLPRPGASKAPPSSEAHIHAPSQPEAYPNRAPSPDAMNIFNAALQNAKSRLDRHPSPTADDILKTSLQAPRRYFECQHKSWSCGSGSCKWERHGLRFQLSPSKSFSPSTHAKRQSIGTRHPCRCYSSWFERSRRAPRSRSKSGR
ncbi:hypothetical protein BT69DRAFT_137113 [Atractiella rhizophila]|nr:hypothetical protein BT69DRAFT_137113 [Atractiella rhizophila]